MMYCAFTLYVVGFYLTFYQTFPYRGIEPKKEFLNNPKHGRHWTKVAVLSAFDHLRLFFTVHLYIQYSSDGRMGYVMDLSVGSSD